MEASDTDTLLALVSSLLPSPPHNQALLLDALVECDGNAQEAARLINSKAASSDSEKIRGMKRKRPSDLKDWLKSSVPKSDRAKGKEVSAESLDAVSDAATPSVPKSPTKPVVDLMSVLRQPPSAPQTIPRLSPLTLSNPNLVALHTPCTLHPSVLPPELACRLFYTMIDVSRGWQRNKWWLFDRLVESPHRTSFYARKSNGVNGNESWQEAAQYWYNGRKTDTPAAFPPEMEDACEIIERVVNSEMRKRKRFPLEWDGTGSEGQIWRANVAASNCYEGAKECVGFHSDQMTYLGPYPTIASLSLGTRRMFSLREVIPSNEASTRRAQTFNIPLPHNSLIIMHPPTQEFFKHSIPPQSTIDIFRPPFPRTPSSPITPSNSRINITFRFYRPDFEPSSTPRCKCGLPTVLKADMKGRDGQAGEKVKYWWICYAAAQNEGKGCSFWKVMDIKAEGRGPVVGNMEVESLTCEQ